MDGFAFSAEALTGRFAGAGDRDMTKRCVRTLLMWSCGVALLFTAAYGLGSGLVASLLTDEESVREGVREMRYWIWLIPLSSVWAFIYDGFYVGITETGKMLLATMAATIVFFTVAFVRCGDTGIYIGTESNNMLWSAFVAYLFLRGVVLAILWRSESEKRFRKR